MSNKPIVQTYMEGFNEGDYDKILGCLTKEVVWIMPGHYRKNGIEEFRGEILNDAFVGRPIISIIQMVEEGNVVIAEGTVKCEFKAGGWLDAVFCDVFIFENSKIKQLTSYLMNLNPT
ncbi:MAG: nuclear transport factor 2 family protein [Bacteroidetes bacterium]|nr:nuclear transport factor 2 family protein [Bacteroidota bacterium]